MTKKHRFVKAVFLYALIFVFIAAVALSVLWLWTDAFEKSRPLTAVNDYVKNITMEDVTVLAQPVTSTVSDDMQSDKDICEGIYAAIKTSKPAKNANESLGDEASYYLMSQELALEHLTLKQSGEKGRFGMTPWAVTGQELLLDNLAFNESSFSIPSGYTVTLNGAPIPDGFVTSSDSEYELLKGFYEEFPDLPHLVSYSTGPYIGTLDLAVLDDQGNSIPLNELTEAKFCDNCAGDIRDRLDEFCRTYIDAYVYYTSNGSLYGGIGPLLDLCERGSSLYTQVSDSQMGFGFSNPYTYDVLEAINVNSIMDVGNGYYVCDISYDIETHGNHHAVTEWTYPLRLMVHDNGGQLLAVSGMQY